MLTAIVTDVRFRMSLAIIRDLSEAGVKVIAVEFDGKTPPLGFYSKYVSKSLFMDEDNYIDELYALCKAEMENDRAKPALIPVGTATLNILLDEKYRKRFEEVAGFCIPTKEQVDLLNDKERLHEYASSIDIPVPKEYKEPYENVKYPCVVKPLCGEKYGIKAAQRYRIVNNEIQLKSAIARFTEICEGEIPIVQQYLDGSGFGCSIFAKEGKVMASITHKRIREYPITGGPSSCCDVVHIGELQDYTEKIVKELNFSGIAMFEYKMDSNGNYYLLESNPRVWGSYPLTRAAKCNITQQWFTQSYKIGNPESNIKSPRTNFTDVRMHFALTDLRAGIDYIKSGNVKLGLGAIGDTLNPKVKGGLFEWSDLAPSLKYLIGLFSR